MKKKMKKKMKLSNQGTWSINDGAAKIAYGSERHHFQF